MARRFASFRLRGWQIRAYWMLGCAFTGHDLSSWWYVAVNNGSAYKALYLGPLSFIMEAQ